MYLFQKQFHLLLLKLGLILSSLLLSAPTVTRAAALVVETHQMSDFNMRHLGYTLSTLKYYQLGVNIDLTVIYRNLDLVVSIVNATYLKGIAKYGPLTRAEELHDSYFINQNAMEAAAIHEKITATWALGSPVGVGPRVPHDDSYRTKRNPLLFLKAGVSVVGVLNGLYKTYQLRAIKKQMQAQGRTINNLALMVAEHQTRLGKQGVRLDKLESWAAEAEKRILTMHDQHHIEAYFRLVRAQADDAAHIMDLLLTGRLSHRAVLPEAMDTIMTQMSREAESVGNTLLVKSSGEAFQSRASYLPTDEGFFGLLHLPMATNEDLMDLWVFIGVPLQMSPTRHMTIHPGLDVVAVSQDKSFYRAMSLADLTLCDKRGPYHFCGAASNMNTQTSVTSLYQGQINDQLCVLFIYEGKFEHVRSACRFHVDKPSEQGFILSGTEVVFVSTAPRQGVAKCPSQIETTFQVAGITSVTVPVGCTASTDYFHATGTEDPTQDGNIRRASRWPAALPPIWADLDLDLLDLLDADGISNTPTDLDDLKIFLDDAKTHRWARSSHVALWSTVILLLAAGLAGLLWLWRQKNRLQRKMRALMIQGIDRVFRAMDALGIPADPALRAEFQLFHLNPAAVDNHPLVE